jgi:fatty-acyl-CoA synthase
MYFNDWLTRRRLYTPDRIAIDDESNGRSYTYAELDSRAGRMAALLRGSYEVGRSDRVACLATSRMECIDLYFACGKIGAIFVPLNTRLPAARVLELLEDCQPQLFVYESAFDEVADAAERGGVAHRFLAIDSSDWLQGDQSAVDVLQADEHDVAMILYTSGTTGRPKGAMISWRQIHWNALNTTIGLQLTENDTAFLNMPLYHTGAWHVLFTPLMLLGGRVILQKRFDAQRCNDQIGLGGVSILFGVPTMLRMMSEAENFSAADLSQVRFAICGGEPCPVPLIETYQQRGVAIRQGYGLTEAGPNCFSLP